MSGLVSALESAPNQAAMAAAVGTALDELGRDLDNVLAVRASIGSRLQEIDALASLGEDLHVQYEQTLSGLQDVDYAQAISQLTREQANLEAAQRSFLRIGQLSLFNLL
jgi:flagellar hook-associated protein 3 FlgL